MPIKIVVSSKRTSRSRAKHTARPLKPEITIKVTGRRGKDYNNSITREPDYTRGEDRILHEEQQTSRVEIVMLKGHRDRNKIGAILSITPSKVDDYMRRVFARWEIEGGQKHFTTYRGEMVLKLRHIEIKMWDLIDAEEAKKDAKGNPVPLNMEKGLAAYERITAITMRRAEMLGLTKEMVERMMETETEENLNFKRTGETYDNASRVAARVFDLVEEYQARSTRLKREADARTIEHEARRESP